MRHITLLTDFGTTEGEHTVLKGVIWQIVPGNPIADLSHDIAAQNIHQAALVLERTAHYFPQETIHVVVVDPGVGTARKAIAARFGDYFFVGPDNGVFTPLLERAEKEGKPIEIVELDNPAYWVHPVSPIFHGRDIFAPAGGHLAKGVSLSDLGSPVEKVCRYHIPKPEITDGGLIGEVMHIDSFGNLICNISRGDLQPLGRVCVTMQDVELGEMMETFGQKKVGEMVALYSPNGYLMIAQTNGSAHKALSKDLGDSVRVFPCT